MNAALAVDMPPTGQTLHLVALARPVTDQTHSEACHLVNMRQIYPFHTPVFLTFKCPHPGAVQTTS